MKPNRHLLVLIGALCASLAAPLAAQITWEMPLSFYEEVVPGSRFLGPALSPLRAPRLNSSGQIAAQCDVYYNSITRAAIIQSSANGAAPWRIVARTDDAAPGMSGFTINSITDRSMVQADTGAVLWNGIAKPASGSYLGAAWLDGGTATLLAKQGGNPAGSIEVLTSDIGYSDRLRLSNQGLPLVIAAVARGSNYAETLLSGLPGQFGIVALAGELPPGDTGGYVYGGDVDGSGLKGGFLSHFVSGTGHIAFSNETFLPSHPSNITDGVWDKVPGGSVVLRQFGPFFNPIGMPPTGSVQSEYFVGLRAMASGARLLIEQFTYNGTDYGSALFQSLPGATLAFSAGLPGTIDNMSVDFPNRALVAYSDSGIIASYFEVTGIPQSGKPAYGLAVNNGSGWKMLALNNTQAPGLPAGVNYQMYGNQFDNDLLISTPSLTPQGRLLFVTRLQGTGVTPSNNLAIWITQPGGVPQLVLRTGQTVTSPRFTKTVSDFYVNTTSGGDDGKPRSHNDSGKIVVGIYPTDSSGGGIWLASAGPTVAPDGGLPVLNISRSGSQVTLSWTTPLTGLILESSTTLVPPWQTVGTTPIQTGNAYTVTLSATEPKAFYRLRKP